MRKTTRKAILKKKIGTKFGTLTPQGKVVNSMTININKLKSKDPLAYAYGMFQAKSGQKMAKAEKGDKLAPEFIRGYREAKTLKNMKETEKFAKDVVNRH